MLDPHRIEHTHARLTSLAHLRFRPEQRVFWGDGCRARYRNSSCKRSCTNKRPHCTCHGRKVTAMTQNFKFQSAMITSFTLHTPQLARVATSKRGEWASADRCVTRGLTIFTPHALTSPPRLAPAIQPIRFITGKDCGCVTRSIAAFAVDIENGARCPLHVLRGHAHLHMPRRDIRCR
jgi:hypothetical protein